jgi:hypothetical protein
MPRTVATAVIFDAGTIIGQQSSGRGERPSKKGMHLPGTNTYSDLPPYSSAIRPTLEVEKVTVDIPDDSPRSCVLNQPKLDESWQAAKKIVLIIQIFRD